MNTIIRAGLVLVISIAGLGGCSSVRTATEAVTSSVGRIFHPASPTAPAPAGLDDYKTQVAHHVADHNPERAWTGTLPPMLPAIVVLEITVDRDGQLADVAVQRSRNPDASEIALASVRRSSPLPPPPAGRLTFSETFLFADSERYQLRSLAGPQASESPSP
ncbi:TonB family protein [Massilia sp. CT11-108]|jgi:protein TonB|uniref:TonB family protein n=1 Tax=Massilia sp. CT11-108 TaxID=3393900 RepID=UPI0039A4F120